AADREAAGGGLRGARLDPGVPREHQQREARDDSERREQRDAVRRLDPPRRQHDPREQAADQAERRQPCRRRLDEQPGVQDREQEREAEEGGRRYAVVGQVEQQHERRDEHGATAPGRRERALEAPGQDGDSEVGEPERQIQEQRRPQPLGREVARRPRRLRHQHEEDGDVVERAALAQDRRRGGEPQQHEGRAEEQKRRDGRRLERDESGNGDEQERRDQGGARQGGVARAPEGRRQRLGEQVEQEESADD